MKPLNLLVIATVLWALCHFWLIPLIKQQWVNKDLSSKVKRAGLLVLLEKLREICAIVGVTMLIVIALVALTNSIASSQVVWPLIVIQSLASFHRFAKEWSDGFGIFVTFMTVLGAGLVLWLSAAIASANVRDAWIQKANEIKVSLINDTQMREKALQLHDGGKLATPYHQATKDLAAAKRSRPVDEIEVRAATSTLDFLLTELAMEIAKSKDDFAELALNTRHKTDAQTKRWYARIGQVLMSKKLSEDLGLVRKPLSWCVTVLLLMSLTGWIAEPLANSSKVAIATMRIYSMASDVDKQLKATLASTQAFVESAIKAEAELITPESTRLVAQAFIRELASSSVMRTAKVSAFDSEAKLVKHLLERESEKVVATNIVEKIHAETAQSIRANAGSPQELATSVQDMAQSVMGEMAQSNPRQLQKLLLKIEARYAVNSSPLDAQGRLVGKIIEESFAALDAQPSDEMSKQAQKLIKDTGKEAAKTWATAAMKKFIVDTLADATKPSVQEALFFSESKLLDSLKKDLANTDIVEIELRNQMRIASDAAISAVIKSVEPKERSVPVISDTELYKDSGNRRFVKSALDEKINAHLKSAEEHERFEYEKTVNMSTTAQRKFYKQHKPRRVKGILLNASPYAGDALDVRDIRWHIDRKSGHATRVQLELKLFDKAASTSQWVYAGDYAAAVLNQGLRFGASNDNLVVTILERNGKHINNHIYLHSVLVDTPLGCRVTALDRLPDRVSLTNAHTNEALSRLQNDRKAIVQWINRVRLAYGVRHHAKASCIAEINKLPSVFNSSERAIPFSTTLRTHLNSFFKSKLNLDKEEHAQLLQLNKCAMGADSEYANCICETPTLPWLHRLVLPVDHTAQMHEKSYRVDENMQWLIATAEFDQKLDYLLKVSFSDTVLNKSVNKEQVPDFDFTEQQLFTLRAAMASALPSYVKQELRTTAESDLVKPINEFISAQRLSKAALMKSLGERFPLDKLVILEAATRQFVPKQLTERWEPSKTMPVQQFINDLTQTQPRSGEAFRLYFESASNKEKLDSPVCDIVSH